ncbi:MAG: M28 family peptidase [Asticcacaulis sp.]
MRTLSHPSMDGRGLGTPGHDRARDYIIRRLTALGARPCRDTFIQTFPLRVNGTRLKGENILACLAGHKSVTGPRPVIVLSAHYDHLGWIDKEVHPGANDNASGVGGVLAITESLLRQSPHHDVIIAFFDAEERDLDGSKAFVAQPPVPLSRIRFLVNLDMIGRDDSGEIYASGSYGRPALRAFLQRLPEPGPVSLELGYDDPSDPDNDWTHQSDQSAFHAKGIAHLHFGVADDPDYHAPEDTADKIKPAFYRCTIQLIHSAFRGIDQDLDRLSASPRKN